MTKCRLEQLQQQRMKAAIRTGCIAANIHLTCSYPECKCKTTPILVRAAIEEWIGLGHGEEMAGGSNG